MLTNFILKAISKLNNSINILNNSLSSFLFKAIPDQEICLATLSNFYYYNNNFRKQIDTLFRVLEYNSKSKYPFVNLGYCSSFIFNQDECEYILHKLNKSKLDNLHILKLKINILLRLNKRKGESLVHTKYIEPIVKSNIKTFAEKPILFFHIPKCGGTTIKKLIGEYYYKNFQQVRPNYNYYYLLKYCIQEIPDQFPFLSSSHLDVRQLSPPENIHYKFTVVRNPIKRTMSAFRQTYDNIKSGYLLKTIPKYGGHWYYWGINDYAEWLQSTPKLHVLRQLSTFSPNFDLTIAKNEINKLDKVILLENSFKGISSLLNDLNLPLDIEDNGKKHNKSPKHISIKEEHIEVAKKIHSKEFSLLNYIKTET